MIENHTHISSLRDSGKHGGRCYPYHAPNGALENTGAVLGELDLNTHYI